MRYSGPKTRSLLFQILKKREYSTIQQRTKNKCGLSTDFSSPPDLSKIAPITNPPQVSITKILELGQIFATDKIYAKESGLRYPIFEGENEKSASEMDLVLGFNN